MHSKWFWVNISHLGGGAEAIVMVLCGLFLSSREQFFYYLLVYSIDKMYVAFGKLVYAEPRPYMLSTNVTPLSCSRHFGNPSGHSSAASAIAFALFLDIFHSKPNDENDFKVYSWPVWALSLIAASLWATLMPTSRYFLGMHSAD